LRGSVEELVEARLATPPWNEDQENEFAALILRWLFDMLPKLGSDLAFRRVCDSLCCPTGIKTLTPGSYRWRKKIFEPDRNDAGARRRKK
jgi:hypothetical protein